MKRTILLFIILCTRSAFASVVLPDLTTDTDNPIYYVIQNYRSYKYAAANGNNASLVQDFLYQTDAHQFYFLSANGSNDVTEGVYIVNKATGLRLASTSSFTEDGAIWYIKENPWNEGYVCVSLNSALSSNCWDDQSSHTKIGYYSPREGDYEGTSWTIAQAPLFVTSTESSPIWYYVKSYRNRYLYADGGNLKTNSSNGATSAYQWAFIEEGNGVKIVNRKNLEENNKPYINGTSMSDDAGVRYYWNNNQEYPGYFTLSTAESNRGTNRDYSCLNDNGAGGLADWLGRGNDSGGSQWCTLRDVTYVLKYDERELKSDNITQPIGSTTQIPSSLNKDYTVYSYNHSTVPAEGNIIVDVSFNTPFKLSDSFENAIWYYVNAHATYSNTFISVNNNTSVWNTENQNQKTDAYQWGFMGNPIEGIKIINKAAGTGKYLNQDDPAAMTTDVVAWDIREQNTSYTYGTNTFGFWSSAQDKYMNVHDGGIKYWSSFDQGSTFWISFADPLYEDYSSIVSSYISAYQNSKFGYFYLLSSGTEINNYASAENAAMTKHGRGAEQMTQSEYDNAISLFEQAISKPATGYYRIKSKLSTDDYGYMGLNGTQLRGNLNEVNDPSTIIQVTKTNDGYYQFRTQGKYGNTASKSTAASMDASAHSFYLLTNQPGYGYIKTGASNDYSCYHISKDASYNIVGWEAGADASQWKFEDATSIDVTVNDGGDGYYYATRYFDFPVQGDGLYILTPSGGDKVTATKVSAVPAGEGFLIRCAAENVSDNKVTLTIPATAPTLSYENLFDGNCLATTVDANSKYIFSKVGDELGFFLYSGTSMPANRAYLTTETKGRVRGFVLSFEDEETGVASVVKTPFANNIFDLQGRRVTKTAKGLYIQNGKKIMY